MWYSVGPFRVGVTWRRRFGQGALASFSRCFSTSSIRTPPLSLPNLRSQLSFLLPSRPTDRPLVLSPSFPFCAASPLSRRDFPVPPNPPALAKQPIPLRCSEDLSTMMAHAVPLDSAATTPIRGPAEPAEDAELGARVEPS